MRKTGQIYRLSGGMVPDRICKGCGNCRKEKIGHRKPDGGHTDAETEKVKGEKACEERRILYHLSGSGKM